MLFRVHKTPLLLDLFCYTKSFANTPILTESNARAIIPEVPERSVLADAQPDFPYKETLPLVVTLLL